tara:strand:+ start:3414 stop:4502 length:1089 start_codon:yes stop_codon:yes gene_type:complete
MNMSFDEYRKQQEAKYGPMNNPLSDAINNFYNNQVVPTGRAILSNINAPAPAPITTPQSMKTDKYAQDAIAADPALLTMLSDGTQPPRLTIPQTNRAAGTTDQQRKMTPFSLTPPTPPANNRIGTNEMLMRVGGAMMGGAQQGGLNAMDKGLAAYGQIQDANRATDASQYATELDQYNKGMAALLKAQKKGKGNNPAAMLGSIVVNDAIGRAIPLISNFSAGVGSYLKILPATDAKNLERLLDAVKANAGFDKLQDMRDNSPTGGALGQVSNLELNFLQSVFGNLDQDQSPAQLRYNLQMFQWVYNTLIHGFDNHQFQPPAGSEASVNQLRSIMQAGAASGAQTAPAQQGYDYSAADAIVGN